MALAAFESRDSSKSTIAYDENLPRMAYKAHYELVPTLPLWEFPMDDTRIHDWRAKCLYAYEDPGISHIKCYMASAIIGDERLLRGEILSLLRLFRGRLRNKGMENHVVAPNRCRAAYKA
ncbi:hypothetical protein BDV30DRAFT_240742 [Aspergillus minisclerotigenes]|uniref:Uncharacterized protein n=1 Tax=Aspergillus minisclerotigenes TaxID=656917 RepID=A0A5N6IY85_9EURO|nr:hypothetical protein BDV30DRAFT_240742 [Aspergillus minisclerotigenes]